MASKQNQKEDKEGGDLDGHHRQFHLIEGALILEKQHVRHVGLGREHADLHVLHEDGGAVKRDGGDGRRG